jgi:hypothetical protein
LNLWPNSTPNAKPITIGPAQDVPARLHYKTQLRGNEHIIENPTTEDLKLVMGIIRMVKQQLY